MTINSWQVITLINIFTCSGKELEGKVVGGGFAAIYQFPHAVYLSASCGDDFWGCGSSILTDTLLLTAAHCFEDCAAKFHVDAYAGTDDVEHVNYVRRIKKYVIHDRYDPATASCDIALLRVKSPLMLGDATKRVIIRRSFPLFCEAQMAGWGDINDDGEGTFRLKKVFQKVRPTPTCGNRGKTLKVRSGMMCASSDSPDDYPASGDSGSALVMADSQQIGIVSMKAQGPHISSVIYTNVSFFFDWIVLKSERESLDGEGACAESWSICGDVRAVAAQSATDGRSANMWLQCLAAIVLIAATTSKEVFTNSFLVRFKRSVGHDEAHLVAQSHGFENLGPVLGSDTEWHFAHRGLPHARPRRSIAHSRLLKQHPLVHAAVQQPGFKRVKRGFRALQLPETVPTDEPRDPYFPLQWYLKNTGQNGGKPKLDLNVEAAWTQGYTGVNVTTAIMDDGVDYMHPDLKFNYNAEASYDFSSNDPFPYPRYTDDWFNSHGTRCAGEVAAARDNGVCGVGVAYHSKVAGIRMLDQPYMTDLIEANSMGHEPHKIHIYSASWGPTDDGRTVDGPRNATMRAIVRGVNEGRNGLGNIYVWASGDGGEDDDCNCDGYAASMWTVSINSAINDGQNAHYDESCSSTLASTFSNGARDPSTGVATTDLYGKCTATHSGTSAAAPEAAGVFALALHANPNLTWRDIQHLTVLTSKRNSLYDAKGRFHWTMNGVGLEFNHLFGFGVLDAGAMTALAANWRSVPPRYHCEAGSVNTHTEIPSEGSIKLTIDTKACEGSPSEVRYLEHVQAVVSANSTRRGDLEFFLSSPMGTKSMILSRRANDDDSRDGFTKWPFMTTHTWGEYPQGIWTLEARFNSDSSPAQAAGWVRGWSLVLHGTRVAPYAQLQPKDPHSKLAVVKKAHEDNAASK